MKKVLSFMLAVLMIASVFPLTLLTVFAESDTEQNLTDTQAEDGYSGYTPMANTLYKLIEEGELTVGYIGDSIGAGQNTRYNSDSAFIDYAPRNYTNQGNPLGFTKVFTDWLEWYAKKELGVENVDIDPYYSTLGGATIAQALSYLREDICAYTPDLVVIEIYNPVDNSEVWFESVIQQIYASNPYCDIIVFCADGQCSTWTDVREHYGIPFVDGISPLRQYFTRTDIFGSGATFEANRGYYFGDYPHINEEGYAFYSKTLIDAVEKLFDAAEFSENYGKYSITQPASKLITMNGEDVVYPTDTYSEDLYYFADLLYFPDFEYDSNWKVTGTENDPVNSEPYNRHGIRYITATADDACITFSFYGTTLRVYSPNGNGAYSVYEIDEDGEVISTVAENLTWMSGYFELSATDANHTIKIVAKNNCVINSVQVYGHTGYTPVEKVTANELYVVNYYGRIADENLHDLTLNGYNALPKYLTYLSFYRAETYKTTATASDSSILHEDVNTENFIGWIEADDIAFYEGEKFPVVYPYTYNEGDSYVTSNGTQKTLYKEGDTIALSENIDLVAAYSSVPTYTVTLVDGESNTAYDTTDVFVFPTLEAEDNESVSFTDGENTYVAGDVICVGESKEISVVRETAYSVTVKNGDSVVAQGQTAGSYTLPDALTSDLDYVTFGGWSDGVKTYPAGTTVTVTEDTVFTAAWKESIVLHECATKSWWTSSTHSVELLSTTDTVVIDFAMENFGNISGENNLLIINGVTVVKMDGSRNAFVGDETESHITFSNQWKGATMKVTITDLSTGEATVYINSDGKTYTTTVTLGAIGDTVTLTADKKANNISDKISQLVDVRPRYNVTYTDGETVFDTALALGSVVLPSFEIADTHKILVGWTDGTTNYNIGDTVEITKDTTFTAIVQTVYTATFSGEGVEETTQKTNSAAQIALMAAPTREGFEFIGWSDGENTYAAGETVTLVDDTVFTAVWKELVYVDVSFYNGTTLISGPTTVLGKVTMPDALTSTIDYATFAGWSDGEEIYEAGETVTVIEDTVFTAVWKEKAVLHETPGKTWWTSDTHVAELLNTTDTVIIEFGIQIASTGASKILQINGKDVITMDDSRNAFVGDEEESGITFDQWSWSTVTVTITDLQTGEATVYIYSKGATYTTTITLGEIGSTITLTGDSKSNNSSDKVSQLIDLRPRYTVTVNDENGDEISSETTLGEVTLPTPELRDGYAFRGWNDGTSTFAAGSTVTVTGDTTFTAVWEAVNVYNITFTYGDDTVVKNWTAEREYTLPTDTFTREGFVLNGWKNSLGKYFAAGEAVIPTKDETYTAIWGLDYSATDGMAITDSYAKVSKEGNSGLMIEATVAKPQSGSEFTEFGLVFIQSAGLSGGDELVISGIYTFTEEKTERELSANVVNAKAGIYTEDSENYYFDVLLTDFWYQYMIQADISVRPYAKVTVDGVETIYYGETVTVNYFDEAIEAYNDNTNGLTDEEREILYMSVLNFGDLIVRNWVDSSKTKVMGGNYPAIQSSTTLGYKQLSNLLYKIKNNEDVVIGYLGGSITAGQTTTMPNGEYDSSKCFANQVTEWLQDYAESIGSTSTVTKVNAGISGTASLFGLARLHKDLFLNDTVVPDLIFIEYSSNDWLTYATGDIIDQVTRFESIIKEIYAYNPKADIIMLSTNKYGLTNPNDPNMTTYIMETVAKYYNLAFINVGTYTYTLGMNEVYTAIKAGTSYADFMASGIPTDANGLSVLTEEIYNDLYHTYYGAKELIEVRNAGNTIETSTTYAQYLDMLGTESYMNEELYSSVLATCAGANYRLDTAMRNRGIAWAMADFLHPTSFGYTMYTKIISNAMSEVLKNAETLPAAVNVPFPSGIYGDAIQYLINDLYSIKTEGLIENVDGWEFKVNGNYKWAEDNTALVSSTVGSSFEFDFTGTGFALVENVAHKNQPVVLEYSVDGGEYKQITLADGNMPQMYLFASGLEYGDHHVTVRYASGTGLANIAAIYVFSNGVQILPNGTVQDYTTEEYNIFSFRYDVEFDDSSLYFTITYHESSENGAQTQEVKLTKGSIVEGLMACPWTKDGYVFEGWIDMATGELITNETFKLEEDLDLVASWRKTDIEISFGHSVTFENNLSLNYYIPTASLEGYDSFYLVVKKGDELVTITDYTETADGYKFVFEGISACEAGVELEATLYAVKDGETYASNVDTYSVKIYAYNRLAESTDPAFKTLLVDMLNYCAAAQTYFGVDTENLVNAELTNEQKALATQTDADVSGATSTSDTKEIIRGKSVVFNSNVELKFYMDLSAYDDITLVTVKLEYTANGVATVKTVDYNDFAYNSDYSSYTVKITDIAAADLRDEVKVTVLYDGEEVSDTVSYNVAAYVNSRLTNSTDESFKTLLKELMKYSDSAKTYFNK